MKHFLHDTGRSYDKAQILEIWVEQEGTDEWGCGFVTAIFHDDSRHIKGRVIDAPVFSRDICGAVLSAYDHGHYESL